MTIWVTKFALTEGKIKLVKLAAKYQADYYSHGGRLLKIGRDVFEDEESAKAGAEKMRLRKIASLEKALAKLRVMVF
jgi:hypothetical protein